MHYLMIVEGKKVAEALAKELRAEFEKFGWQIESTDVYSEAISLANSSAEEFSATHQILLLLDATRDGKDEEEIMRASYSLTEGHRNLTRAYHHGCCDSDLVVQVRSHLFFEASLLRPRDFFLRAAKEQWEIDSGLGILDWSGDKLGDWDDNGWTRFHNHFHGEPQTEKAESWARGSRIMHRVAGKPGWRKIFEFQVLHYGWELDNKGWIAEDEQGGRHIILTNHGREYEATEDELNSFIAGYEKTIAATRQALSMLQKPE